MNRRNAGFTLIEMLIVIAIIGFVLAGTSQMFISTLRTHRQQSRITETNIEGIIGLELFRQDLEKAGYGLPWNMNGITYNEADGNPHGLNDATSNAPPRGIVSDDNHGFHSSDYLAIKAANVATNAACSKWTFLMESGSPSTFTSWDAPSDNLSSTDRVIVISPGTPNTPNERTLMTVGTQWRPQFSAAAAFQASVAEPEARVIYGIDTGDIRMPFNRADYYVKVPSSKEMPKRCAPGTGILYKGVVRQSDGYLQEMPLLDCVADMQVIFRYTDSTGNLSTINTYDDISVFTSAEQIRNQIKEARVYILAHEGQRDLDYRHPRSPEHVGDPGHGSDFDLTTITNWQNYRWKIYTLVVQLNNLR